MTANRRDGDGARMQVVSFTVGDEEYAVDVLQIEEINRPMAVTEVPHAAPFVQGVVNLRGRVIPVLDLRKMLGRGPQGIDKSTRVIVADLGGKTFGLVVDAVHEVLLIPAERIEPTPQGSRMAHCLDGVAKVDKRLVVLLNLAKLAAAHGLGTSTPLAA